MTSPQESTLLPDDASRHWETLAARVDGLIRAWEGAEQPPELGEHLPAGPPPLRRLALVELIKVDLEYRWKRPAWRATLETYLAWFPELAEGEGLPCDLIYEEFHIRRQAGDTVDPREYQRRFPSRAAALGRLLDFDAPHVTTMLVPTVSPTEFKAGQTVDDFDLLARLGKGAFASVFLARQRSMQRLVALKVSADRGNEPQTMAQLEHPHIVRVYDQRRLPERRLRLLYMQYVPGGTLQAVAERVRATPPALRGGSLVVAAVDAALDARGDSPPADAPTRRLLAAASWPEAVGWLGARLAAALDYAHQRGVLHRDIKPANVLVAADGSPKLADFNISFCDQLEGSTAAAYFGGSLAYMSPEQLEACQPSGSRRPEELDGRSDVYSLAVMLWELLAGSRPFPDEPADGGWNATLDAMLARRRAGLSATAMALLPANTPPGLLDALRRALEADPARRYASAREFGRELELSLRPRLHRFLRPARGDWLGWLRRFPLETMVAAVIVPNAVCSVANIAYNFTEIIDRLEEAHVVDLFYRQVATVNPVLYGIGIALGLWMSWPTISATRRRLRGETVPDETLSAARLNALGLGDFVAWLSGICWTASGLIFPAWIHWQVGHLVDIGPEQYAHFLVSQVLSGLIAATSAFFAQSVLNLRLTVPVLIQPDREDPALVEGLRRLVARARVVTFAAAAVPFMGILAFVLANVGSRLAFGVLTGLGLAGFAACFAMLGMLQRDAELLVAAVSPGPAHIGASSEPSESFWTGSR